MSKLPNKEEVYVISVDLKESGDSLYVNAANLTGYPIIWTDDLSKAKLFSTIEEAKSWINSNYLFNSYPIEYIEVFDLNTLVIKQVVLQKVLDLTAVLNADLRTAYEIAYKLKYINKNNKQQTSCLDTIIFYLEHNDIRRAKNTISNEWDKISSHKDVVECLKTYNLLPFGMRINYKQSN